MTVCGPSFDVFHLHQMALSFLFQVPTDLSQFFCDYNKQAIFKRFISNVTIILGFVPFSSALTQAGCVEIGENIINTTYIFSRKAMKR